MTTSVQSESAEALLQAPMAINAGDIEVMALDAGPEPVLVESAAAVAEPVAETMAVPPLIPDLIKVDDSAYKVFLDIQKIIESISAVEDRVDMIQIIRSMQEVLDGLTLEEYLTLSNTPPLPTESSSIIYPSVIKQVEDYINILMDHIEKAVTSNTKISVGSIKESLSRITPTLPKGFYYV